MANPSNFILVVTEKPDDSGDPDLFPKGRACPERPVTRIPFGRGASGSRFNNNG